MAMANIKGGEEALHKLKSIDPPIWLTPSPDLSETARTASQHLFSSLKPFCTKSYLNTLLIQGFDSEQIWQQIDLQTEPLMSVLKRDVRRFEKNADEIPKLFEGIIESKIRDEIEDEDEVDGAFGDEEDEGEEDDEDEEKEEDEEEEEEDEGRGIEDRFLKMNELEKYMEEDEEREYGGGSKKKVTNQYDDDEDEDDDDEIGGFEDDSDGEEGVDSRARYEDFFGGKKKKDSKRKSRTHKVSEDEEEEEDVEEEDDDDDEGFHNQTEESKIEQMEKENTEPKTLTIPGETEESLSTYEKDLQKRRSKIEQMEKENMEPKTWPMRGEVTAAKRPMNSALEVDLDFEHNVRPLPVITEEVTVSLEELIKKRILEVQFDDVQKAPRLPSKPPKEIKELDENKSKKGLADIYEDEYAQQTGLGSGPVSSSDELKKEAQQLFDRLCLKLDALSHFHFKPKPVIEDMTIQTNVPALAMEEIAPVAVSDAAMLAPEEVFSGKGDIKEEAELTQAERKRRRANKKRKFKAEASNIVKKKVRHTTED